MFPEQFALHSRRIGGATRLAVRGVQEAVTKKGGRWSSDSFTVYVRANMERPAWVSEVLERGAWEFDRQPGQGTICLRAEWDMSPLPGNVTTAWGTAIGPKWSGSNRTEGG